MIEFNVINKPYQCKIKELLWFQEMRQTVAMLTCEGKTMQEIREQSSIENIFNAASKSRANEIGRAIANRIAAVDHEYLQLFMKQDIEMQKLLSVISVMLDDHTFFEFMDQVYREKLIINDLTLGDAECIGYIHDLQSRNEKAASWTDGAVRRLRDYFKAILRDGGLISKQGEPRTVIKPIMTREIEEFLQVNRLDGIRKILAGER